MKMNARKSLSLERLNAVIDWNSFRTLLEKAFKKESKGSGGRPPYDIVLMFKILVLQRIYNLSDDETEFQINDRIPDAKTIWYFRDRLVEQKAMEKLFERFNRGLEKKGIIKNEGVIVDATFVDSSRRRNKPEENESIM